MGENEKQGELFGQFQDEGPSGLSRLAKKMLPAHKNFAVVLRMENLVMVSIGFLLAMILVFALGVERGKHLAHPEKNTLIEAKAEKVLRDIESQAATGVYTIQLISLKSKDVAQKQTSLLKKRGEDAFLLPSGVWFQVCLGRYATREEAFKDVGRFNTEFKGCFVRKIK